MSERATTKNILFLLFLIVVFYLTTTVYDICFHVEAKEGQIIDDHKEVIESPFSRNRERYHELYTILLKGGMHQDRIRQIFFSKRAKEMDMTPLRMMTEIKKIPELAEAEKKANTRYLSRIPDLIKHLKKYKTYYDLAESTYGVNRELIAAVLLKETNLGQFHTWKHDSFTVLNTMLSFLELPENPSERMKTRIHRFIEFSKEHLAALLLFCDKHHIDIIEERFPSSYAGAIGIAQFMPGWLEYAISADNKTPDLNKMPDAILSVGNVFKHKLGWSGMIDYERLENIDDIINKWYVFDKRKGVSFAVSHHLDGMPLRRFDKEFDHIPNVNYIGKFVQTLMEYNFSSNYALGILQIAFHTNKQMNQ